MTYEVKGSTQPPHAMFSTNGDMPLIRQHPSIVPHYPHDRPLYRLRIIADNLRRRPRRTGCGYFSARASKACNNRSMSAEVRLPIVEIRNSRFDKSPCPA